MLKQTKHYEDRDDRLRDGHRFVNDKDHGASG